MIYFTAQKETLLLVLGALLLAMGKHIETMIETNNGKSIWR